MLKFSPSMVVAEKLYATGLERSCGVDLFGFWVTELLCGGLWDCLDDGWRCGGDPSLFAGCADDVPDRAGGYDGCYCQGCSEHRDGYQSPAFVVFVFPGGDLGCLGCSSGFLPRCRWRLNQAAIPVLPACLPELRRSSVGSSDCLPVWMS